MDRPEAPLLFAVLEYGEFPEMLRVAEALHKQLGRPVAFWFVKASYRRLAQDSAAVVARGFTWLDTVGQSFDKVASGFAPLASNNTAPSITEPLPQLPQSVSRRGQLGRWLALISLPLFVLNGIVRDARFVLRSSARDLANFTRDVRRFRARYQVADGVLESVRPALVVVGQDVPGTDLQFLLIAAGRQRIPRLMTAFAMFSLSEVADYARAKPDHWVQSSALNSLVAKIYPHWVLVWRGARLLRLPGWRALALEYVGLIEGLPWTPLSEPVEALTVESEAARQEMVELGVDHDRICVVGSPVHDRLFAHLAQKSVLKKRLCLEHGLDPSRPLVVCGWPANIFPWLAGRVIAYRSYDEVAAVWASALAEVRDRHEVNVMVSVHPKTFSHEYQAAYDSGLPCRVGGADELIAASDLFTTLNGSSITAWAIACAVPALLFDCFDTRYQSFDRVQGCVQVQDEQGFIQELSRLCADADARADLALSQRKVAGLWGVLDGGASSRLADLAGRLIREASI